MNKYVIIGILVLVVGYVTYAKLYPQAAPSSSTPLETATTSATAGAREFTVEGKNVSFSIGEIKVKKGDKVRITFKNTEGMHDWRLDEFNAKTSVIGEGKEETVEFVADKVGTFEYYCSVGSHRALGMKGNLIVE